MGHYTPPALTERQIAALDSLRNRPTTYEIEIVAADGRKGLVAYAQRRSAAGLRAAVFQRGAAVLAFLGAPPTTRIEPIKGCRAHTHSVLGTGGAFIRFSGRTKRDVIMADTALAYIGQEG